MCTYTRAIQFPVVVFLCCNTHTHACTHVRMHTHPHTHTPTHPHTHPHTHTHTHTHTPPNPLRSSGGHCTHRSEHVTSSVWTSLSLLSSPVCTDTYSMKHGRTLAPSQASIPPINLVPRFHMVCTYQECIRTGD